MMLSTFQTEFMNTYLNIQRTNSKRSLTHVCMYVLLIRVTRVTTVFIYVVSNNLICFTFL